MTWLVGAAMAQESAPAPAAPAAEAPAAAAPAAPAAAPAQDAAPAAAPADATHTAVGQAEGGHHGPFPPFDTHTFPSQILWYVICFGVLYLLMKRVITPRIASIVEGRAERIEGDFAEAQRLRVSADEALVAYEKALAEARGSAHKIAQNASDEAKVKAETRRQQIEADLAAKLGEAETRIAGIKSRALSEVGSIAEDTAGAVVEALIGKAPSSDEVKSAVAAAQAK